MGGGCFVQAEEKSDLLVWIEVFQLGLRVCYFGHGGLLSFSPSLFLSLPESLSICKQKDVVNLDGTGCLCIACRTN